MLYFRALVHRRYGCIVSRVGHRTTIGEVSERCRRTSANRFWHAVPFSRGGAVASSGAGVPALRGGTAQPGERLIVTLLGKSDERQFVAPVLIGPSRAPRFVRSRPRIWNGASGGSLPVRKLTENLQGPGVVAAWCCPRVWRHPCPCPSRHFCGRWADGSHCGEWCMRPAQTNQPTILGAVENGIQCCELVLGGPCGGASCPSRPCRIVCRV